MSDFSKLIVDVFKFVSRAPANSLILAARVYQKTFGRLYRGVCRFEPSCSRYFILAVQKHGAVIGTVKGVWRVFRCNPFNEGGEDFP